MEFEILTLFPEFFAGPFDTSIIGRARAGGLLRISYTQLRDFAHDKHHKVDDRPFGGGPGMVLKPEPVVAAIRSVRREGSHVIYLSPQGRPLTAKRCQELSEKPHVIVLCGHYEGVDERVMQEIDEELSIGDYVVTSGAVAAVVLVDAVARFVPGVLGHDEAAAQDSFQEGAFDCPHYTRPEVFEGRRVPEVLLSGNHAEIAKWRKSQALEKTRKIRPELLEHHHQG